MTSEQPAEETVVIPGAEPESPNLDGDEEEEEKEEEEEEEAKE